MRSPWLSRQEPREAEGVPASITTVRVRGFLSSSPRYALRILFVLSGSTIRSA